jgi:hypothetical protein
MGHESTIRESAPDSFNVPQGFQSAIARCCVNAAAMLDVADNHDPDKRRREACQKANRGQAELLMEAAQQAHEMLAALQETVLQLEYLSDKFGETGTGAAVLARVNAVIARATGATP